MAIQVILYMSVLYYVFETLFAYMSTKGIKILKMLSVENGQIRLGTTELA